MRSKNTELTSGGKPFNGKAIYQPKNKAAEYSKWACNFYVGCSNGCEYCYCKKGILAPVMGMDKPQLKKCFTDETQAFHIFCKEFDQNIDELKKHGIFFSFTTDPLLPETESLTWSAAGYAVYHGVTVKILTKCAEWVSGYVDFINNSNSDNEDREWRKNYAIGFTLTGHDELEPNASTNQERIEAMKTLHDAGFRTFASIEPIIHLSSASSMIRKTEHFCDLYKIGLLSGKKFDKIELNDFVWCTSYSLAPIRTKIYFKDTLLKASGIDRKSLPSNCVSRDFNIFKNQ